MLDFGIKVIENSKIFYDSSLSADKESPSHPIGYQLNTPLLQFSQKRFEKSTIGHTHDFCHYIYVVNAFNTYIAINSNKYIMSPNCIYLVKPGVFHEIIMEEPYKCEIYELKFHAEQKEFMSIINSLPDVINDTNNFLFEIVNSIIQEYDNSYYDNSMLIVKIMELLLSLKRQSEKNIFPDIRKINLHTKNQERFFVLLDYISKNLASKITIDDMANIMHMEKGHFSKQFKKNFNITPMNYLQIERINRSLSLLEHTDLPISKISEHVGFVNQKSYNKTFKLVTDLTPTEYRAKAKSYFGKH